MDPKLYKTLKQLIKLGILTKNTKVVRRRKKHNGRTSQSTRSVYRIQQPTGNVASVQQYSTPTVQSEQAIVNLKASELQLQKALENKDLPDDAQKKIVLALTDVNKRLNDQQNTITHNYTFQNHQYRNAKYASNQYDQYDISEQKSSYTPFYTGQSTYSQFVPQTKPSTSMSPNIGLLGDKPYVAPTVRDYLNIDNEQKEDIVEQVDNTADEWVDEKQKVNEPEQKGPEQKKPEQKEPKPIITRSKANIQALREEYADLLNVDVANVKKNLSKSDLEYNIHDLKIKNLQQQYRDLGGESKTYLNKNYNSISGLETAIKQLLDRKNKFVD